MSGTRRISDALPWVWLILISTAVGAVVAYLASTQIQPTYESDVTLLVGPQLTNADISMADIQIGQALAPTYADLVTTRPVLERVIASTGVNSTPEELALAIVTRVPLLSNLLEITVSSGRPSEAAAVANALATELAGYPPEVVGDDPSARAQLVRVVDPAIAASTPTSPKMLFNAALGAAVGFALAIGFAFVVENLRGQGVEQENSA